MSKKISNKVSLLLAMGLYIITVVVNTLSARGMINGMSQKAVSQSFPTTITPAGYAFSIWGVIYLLIFASMIMLFIKSEKEYESSIIKNTLVLFCISCIFNVAWTFAFSYKLIWLSAIFIVALLVTVILILQKMQKLHPNRKGLFDVALAVYAGWLFVATLVNIAAFFVSIKFNLFESNKILYAVIVALAVLGGLLLNKTFRNPFFHLAIAWAFIAIMVAINFAQNFLPLFIVLVIGTAVLLFMATLETKKIKFKA